MVETFATWRVTEPLEFFQSVRNPAGANTRLSDILASELGAALGRYELTSLVNTEVDAVQLPAMMKQVAKQVEARTAPYGFAVSDVSLKSVNFPQANRQSVFQRMKAERERIARQFRSEGTEEATKIRAEADAQRTTILSEAEREAERLRGEGEAEAIRIYAGAFGKAPDFYQFLRTLQAYEKVVNEGTTLVLPADSPLLRLLGDGGQTAVSSTSGTAGPRAR
jgi:membrane protease subunit HflC